MEITPRQPVLMATERMKANADGEIDGVIYASADNKVLGHIEIHGGSLDAVKLLHNALANYIARQTPIQKVSPILDLSGFNGKH